jgi:hypothetical protein
LDYVNSCYPDEDEDERSGEQIKHLKIALEKQTKKKVAHIVCSHAVFVSRFAELQGGTKASEI